MDENKRNTLMNCFFTLLLSAAACSSPIIAQSSFYYYSNPAKVGSANEKAFSYYKRAYYDHIWQWSTEGVDSAIYYLNLAIKEDSLYGAAYAFLGHVYQFKTYHPAGINEFEQQKYHAKKALLLNPQIGDAYTLMADVKWHEQDTSEALRLLRTAVKMEPEHAGNYIWLAIRLSDTPGKEDSASYYLHKIIHLDPQYGQAYAKLANVFYNHGHIDSAIYYYKKVIWHYQNVKPRDQRMILGYSGLAKSFRKKQEYDSAVYYYNFFLNELEPSNFYLRDVLLVATYEELFNCYRELTKETIQKLIAENEKRILKNPSNENVLTSVLNSYISIGEDSVSEKYALPLARKMQESSKVGSSESYLIAIYTEAYLLENLERKDEAISVLGQFEKDHPGEPFIQLELARMHILRDDYDKGIEYLSKARNHLNDLVTLERFRLYLRESYFDSVRNDERFVRLLSVSEKK